MYVQMRRDQEIEITVVRKRGIEAVQPSPVAVIRETNPDVVRDT